MPKPDGNAFLVLKDRSDASAQGGTAPAQARYVQEQTHAPRSLAEIAEKSRFFWAQGVHPACLPSVLLAALEWAAHCAPQIAVNSTT